MVIYIYVKILVTSVTVKKGHVTLLHILLPRRHAVLKSFKVVLGNSSPVF